MYCGVVLEHPAEMKACPFCAELVKAEAKKCKHCGEFLDGRQDVQSVTPMPQAGREGGGPVVYIEKAIIGPGGQMGFPQSMPGAQAGQIAQSEAGRLPGPAGQKLLPSQQAATPQQEGGPPAGPPSASPYPLAVAGPQTPAVRDATGAGLPAEIVPAAGAPVPAAAPVPEPPPSPSVQQGLPFTPPELCLKCGSAAEDEDLFCTNCGERLKGRKQVVQKARRSLLAWLALILGVLGFTAETVSLAAILAGILAAWRIQRSTRRRGTFMAVAGMVLGILWLVVRQQFLKPS